MEDAPVTIIVKAPNQQFEDQTIKCEISWTIERLKSYLSEVYPNKPKSDEQKLIYSGKLLRDSAVLKDVLRQYDGQDTHTVHLVFTPKNQSFKPAKPNGSAGSMSSAASTSAAAATAATSAAQSAANELRHRASASAQQPLLFGHTGGAPLLNVQLQQQLLLAQQYAMHNTMQQIYSQYMHQYMSGVTPPNQSTASAVPYPNQLAQQQQQFIQQQSQLQQQQYIYQSALLQQQLLAAAGNQPQPQPQGLVLQQQQQQQQANNNGAVNAAAVAAAAAVPAPVDDNDENNNDWYRASVALQLRQRQLRELNNDLEAAAAQLANDPNANANADGVDGGVAAAAAAAPPPADGAAAVAVAAADASNTVAGQEPNHQRMPVIALIRTFVLSFFASLIPETPHL